MNDWAKWTVLKNNTQIGILDKYYKYGYTGRNILISEEGTVWRTIEPTELKKFIQEFEAKKVFNPSDLKSVEDGDKAAHDCLKKISKMYVTNGDNWYAQELLY